EAIVKAAIDQFGKVDILVNNAGITRDNLLMRMDEAEWDDVIATNLSGPFWMCRAIARPMLKAKSGRIINMSSVAGRMGNAGQVNYASAKAGLIGLTKTVARELASRGITANAIAPGLIQTELTAHHVLHSGDQPACVLPRTSDQKRSRPPACNQMLPFGGRGIAAYTVGDPSDGRKRRVHAQSTAPHAARPRSLRHPVRRLRP